jgi:hypothetical protein
MYNAHPDALLRPRGKGEEMSITLNFTWRRLACSAALVSGVVFVGSVSRLTAKSQPTELPAQVIAHLPLQDAPGSEMLLQNTGGKEYLYIQKSNRQGFLVVDVSRPRIPNLVNRSAKANDATAGTLEMAGPDVGLAEVPDKGSKGVLHSTGNATETVKVLDLTDPAHPKVLQTFSGVTSILQDPGRGLIYLANNDGLWILNHAKPHLAPAKKKQPCGSEDTLSGMPPDCE